MTRRATSAHIEYGAGGSAGGAILAAAPDDEPASVQLARFGTSPRVVGDGPVGWLSSRRLLDPPPVTETVTKTYYYAGAQLIAMRVLTGTVGNTLYYLHSDHLGSTSLTTNVNGAVVARQYYYPYGGVRSGGGLPTDITFTGQRSENSELGSLMFFRARYYSSYLNRWLQPDTIVPEPGNPQDLNRFSYTRNNPLKYTDPTGHCVESGSTCLVEGGSSPETDDLLQWMLFLLLQRDQAVINDLQLMYLFLDKAFQLFSNPVEALGAATNVARPGGLLGVTDESPYVYTRFTATVLGSDMRLGSTGFGDLADSGDQVSHFIGEAYASTIAEAAAVQAHVPSARKLAGASVPYIVELGRPGQDARLATIDADLGSIGHKFSDALLKGVDPKVALKTAYNDINSYDYNSQHPNGPAFLFRVWQWVGPIKQQLGIAQ